MVHVLGYTEIKTGNLKTFITTLNKSLAGGNPTATQKKVKIKNLKTKPSDKEGKSVTTFEFEAVQGWGKDFATELGRHIKRSANPKFITIEGLKISNEHYTTIEGQAEANKKKVKATGVGSQGVAVTKLTGTVPKVNPNLPSSINADEKVTTKAIENKTPKNKT